MSVYGLLCEWEGRHEALEKLRQAVFRACRGMVASNLDQYERTPLTPSHAIAFPLSPAEQLALAATPLSTWLIRWQGGASSSIGSITPQPLLHKSVYASEGSVSFASATSHATSATIGHLTRTMYGLHDRDKFEIWAYSYGPDDGSHYRQEIAQTCDHFIEIRHLSEEESAQRIYEDQIDILVDLVGHSAGRLGILALRPAPIQVHYLGFPGTMGKELVDYFITDHIATPPSPPTPRTRRGEGSKAEQSLPPILRGALTPNPSDNYGRGEPTEKGAKPPPLCEWARGAKACLAVVCYKKTIIAFYQ